MNDIIINGSFAFVIYLIGYSIYLLFSLIIGNIRLYRCHKGLKLKNRLNHEYYVPISILVPVCNHEKVVVEKMKKLLSLDYKLYEIIIIDDGSSDETVKTLMTAFQLKKIKRPFRRQLPTADIKEVYQTKREKVKITIITKEKSGRGDTLNVGINACDYPYFMVIDMNDQLKQDALESIVRPILEEENVIICSGLSKIVNDKEQKSYFPKGMLIGSEALEYNSFSCMRENVFSEISGNAEVKESFDIFQKDMVIATGGYEGVGDQFSLKRKITNFCRSEKENYQFRYVSDAICNIEKENSIKKFLNEERQFTKNFRRTLIKYRKTLWDHNHLFLSLLSNLYVVFYQLLAPIIKVLGVIAIFFAFAFHLINIRAFSIFLIGYILMISMLTFCTFLTRSRVEGEKLSLLELVKIYLVCIFEITIFRGLKTIAKFISF